MQTNPIISSPKTTVLTKTATLCTHSRMVDEVRSADGGETGRLVCKECKVEFPDPSYEAPDS